MVDDPLEALAAVVVQARRVALPPKLLDLLGGMAEDEDVVVRRPASAISTFAPSSVPTVTAPLIINFILPVPLASLPASEICSLTSDGGDEALGERDVVVFEETRP